MSHPDDGGRSGEELVMKERRQSPSPVWGLKQYPRKIAHFYTLGESGVDTRLHNVLRAQIFLYTEVIFRLIVPGPHGHHDTFGCIQLLSEFVDLQTHQVLAMKEMSQLDLVRSRYAERTIELWKLDRLVLDLSFEFAFAYGVFGFGYSNVFRWNTLRPPRDLVQCIIIIIIV